MRRPVFFLASIFGVLFLQIIFSNHFNPLRIQPNFLLVAVIFLSFYADFKINVAIAFLAGFLKDSFTAGIFGANIFSFLICAIILDQYKRYIYREDLYLKVILVFVITLVNGLLNLVIVISSISIPFWGSFLFIVLPESFYTTLVAPALFWIMRKCALKYSI